MNVMIVAGILFAKSTDDIGARLFQDLALVRNTNTSA
jgi:hypothetical protein